MTNLLTIGHSNHELAEFLRLLRLHGITAVADVRSHPVSRRFPWFDKRAIQSSLEEAGIRYVFLGQGLGARPADRTCFRDGQVDFDLVRASRPFAEAMERLRRGAASFRICLMCAERDPADCHRTWLVSQSLHDEGAGIGHILADGKLETHADLLRRVAGNDFSTASLFADESEILSAAARRQGEKVAWRPEESEEEA